VTPPPYRVEVTPAAQRSLRKLTPGIRGRIQGVIEALAYDPRPPAARALKGRPELRVRVGDYRVIYTVHDEVLLVEVVALGHRREIYR
jgi:mRNA interferase RelE/StbE